MLASLALPAQGLAQTASSQSVDRSCVDVQVGSARSFDCINRALRNQVETARPPADPTVVTATSPSNRVGTFNQDATREYLGSSFGHSAIPQPHIHTFAAPGLPRP